MKEVERFLQTLPGVRRVSRISEREKSIILEQEKVFEAAQVIPLKMAGTREIMEREHVHLLLKDSTFRPPPVPTIYLVEELGSNNSAPDHILRIGNGEYRIVGEEVMDRGKTYSEEHFLFNGGLVVFPKRRQGRSGVPALLLIPPIPFPELDENRDDLGITDIVSVSPSVQSDQFLRQEHGFSQAPEIVTVLIGYNGKKGA
jgi:hypothetical protein